MIRRLTSIYFRLECDHEGCKRTYTGDHDESKAEVVMSAVNRAWTVESYNKGPNDFGTRILCPEHRNG